MGKAIGIDLGTTNTAVAVLMDGRPRVLEDDKGYKVLPSCVTFKGDGTRVVGQAAKNLIITRPDQTAYAVKRLMGRRFDSPEVAEVQKLVSYQIGPAPDGGCRIRLGDDWFTPVQISAVLLQVAREMAEKALGEPVTEAVITVPAYFNHAQRAATFEAAQIAGLRCERLLNEPTAAALAYGYRKDIERRIVVYDLGGGTFDVSVLQLSRGIYEVLATSGETHLGGEDFDQRIIDQLSDDFMAKTGVDPRTDATALQRLKDAAERAKCELSFTDRTTILIPMITMADSLETSLTRLKLEGLVEDLVDRTLEITREAIVSAGLRISDIDDVILVGGQTRMPRVREAIRSMFQKEPSRTVHPEEVVAIGAAVHATSLISEDMNQPLLLDVTPFDLGMDVAGGLFKKIIRANSQVPASFTETFATMRDNQRQVRVTVRQGGHPTASDNEFLGEFVMAGLTAAPRMETKVDVTFKIDTNGMLHVSAVEQGTGERKRITIRNYAEFVQGQGLVQPMVEGDLGAAPEEPSLAGGTSSQAGGKGRPAGAEADSPGFLGRLFGRKKAAPAPAAPTPPPVAAPVADAVPEMPDFLRELDDGAVSELEVVDDADGPTGLDAVGAGLDALGFDDLMPLSAADLAPVHVPGAPSAPLLAPLAKPAGDGFGADADDGVFVLPDSDEFYADEDYEDEEESEELYDGAFEAIESEEEESSPAASLAPVDVTWEPDEDEFVEDLGAAVLVDEDDEEDAWVGPGHTPDEAQPSVETFGVSTPTLDALLDVDEFDVDDSARDLVEPAPRPAGTPLPSDDLEDEGLWSDDDLPDDGTIEFTAHGATSTPKAPSWTSYDEDASGELEAEDTLIDDSEFEDLPTDPPLPVMTKPNRIRLQYRALERLLDELGQNLRRGGSFVATEHPLAVGDECLLEFSAPGLTDSIEVKCMVTWSSQSDFRAQSEHPSGMDVEYVVNRHRRRELELKLDRLRAGTVPSA